ncbi:hypothetical protein BWQ96_10047 [Gracilariopsis chorda]|uniref:Uncharacterized protein n=1 Tax=Gracilariopsis chorda TaxID=448386 RepID=A0A2V3IDU0_9FLOR|nr:hypothetical protein BWQ96_10047 [Gracilariopsis chorda]|eukprot:PXF40243.1 hypothetical protein BWQ96_10047 [Gracilariopsis chorda]
MMMAGISGVLGPLLDNYHSQFGVLRYNNPIELHLTVGKMGVDIVTAWFTSPLFMLAGVIIVFGTTFLDGVFGRGGNAQSMGVPKACATVCMFCSIYYLSAVWSHTWVRDYLVWILGVMGLAEWYFMDGSVGGMVMGALTAVCGPALEVALINVAGLYSYSEWDVFGIPWMIVAVYFAGGPAVGNLGRALDDTIRVKQTGMKKEGKRS